MLIWIAGRVAATTSAWTGWVAAGLVDVAFLLTVGTAVAREIMAGRNWGNRKAPIVLGLLFAGNVTFDLEAHVNGSADVGMRIGIAGTVILIMVIGGRIVPSFTRNWLARENPGRLPTPFGRFDVMSTMVAGAALIAWCLAPAWSATGVFLIFAGFVQAARLARWAGERTWRDPLVLVLHVAFAFVPLGFALVGAASLGLLPASAGIHAWTGGAFGGMTLAVMSRASLGIPAARSWRAGRSGWSMRSSSLRHWPASALRFTLSSACRCCTSPALRGQPPSSALRSPLAGLHRPSGERLSRYGAIDPDQTPGLGCS